MAEHDRDDAQWTERIRNELETSARDLDAATLSRLNQARQRALATAVRPKRARWMWSATWASACALALAVAIWPRLVPEPLPTPATAATADDFPMLAGSDSLELYEELDFYAWLDAQSASG